MLCLSLCLFVQDKGVIEEALQVHYKDHQMALQGKVFLEKIVQVGSTQCVPDFCQRSRPCTAPMTDPQPLGHLHSLLTLLIIHWDTQRVRSFGMFCYCYCYMVPGIPEHP